MDYILLLTTHHVNTKTVYCHWLLYDTSLKKKTWLHSSVHLFFCYSSCTEKETSTAEDVSHCDEELYWHGSLFDDELQAYTSGFASKDHIQDDHHLYDQSRYRKMYNWLYYSQVAHGYMCKICEVFYHQCQQEREEVLGVTT